MSKIHNKLLVGIFLQRGNELNPIVDGSPATMNCTEEEKMALMVEKM